MSQHPPRGAPKLCEKDLVWAAVARCSRTAGPPEPPVPAIFSGIRKMFSSSAIGHESRHVEIGV